MGLLEERKARPFAVHLQEPSWVTQERQDYLRREQRELRLARFARKFSRWLLYLGAAGMSAYIAYLILHS